MPTLLIPVDGSEFSTRAVAYAIGRAAACRDSVDVHLLNVQVPAAGVNVKLFVSKDSLESYYREEGMAVLEAPRAQLAAANVKCDYHIGVGDPGQVVVDYARDKASDEIVMGSHGRGALGGALLGSVAQKVVQISTIPVVLVK